MLKLTADIKAVLKLMAHIKAGLVTCGHLTWLNTLWQYSNVHTVASPEIISSLELAVGHMGPSLGCVHRVLGVCCGTSLQKAVCNREGNIMSAELGSEVRLVFTLFHGIDFDCMFELFLLLLFCGLLISETYSEATLLCDHYLIHSFSWSHLLEKNA